jgi:hypothetical protein
VALVPHEAVTSSCDLVKSCTPPDHVLRYNESRTTSLHHQGDGTTSSPSAPWATVGDFCDFSGFHDTHDQQYRPPDHCAASSLVSPCFMIQGAELRPWRTQCRR